MNLHTRTQNWWIKTAAIVSAVNLLVSPIAQAALTWDANGATAGQTDGAGAWLTANQWWNGSTNQTWASSADAIFGNGGTGGAVTLGAGGTTANSLYVGGTGNDVTLKWVGGATVIIIN